MSSIDLRAIRGFYAIVGQVGERPPAAARVVQLRIKSASARTLISEAQRLKRERPGGIVIVNDRLDVALAAGADGVHLGQTDLPLADARRVIGERSFLVGISTHNAEQVMEAVRGGADYLGYGPVFATSTKERPDPVQGVAALARAVQCAGSVPVVAIGGIAPEQIDEVAATGAAAACAIASVRDSPDPERAAARIAQAFERARP